MTTKDNLSPYDGQPLPANQMAYKAKSGKMLIKPSIELAQELDGDGLGFCLNCGAQDQFAEPDMTKGTCDCCGEAKVYGASELILMGLVF